MTETSSQPGGTVPDKTEPLTPTQFAEHFGEVVEDLITDEWDFRIGIQPWRIADETELDLDGTLGDLPLVLIGPDRLAYEVEITVRAKQYTLPAEVSA